MSTVIMRLSRELLEQMLDLGERRITGASFTSLDECDCEPTAIITLEIDAPDAPEGATELAPLYVRAATGHYRMANPHWR